MELCYDLQQPRGNVQCLSPGIFNRTIGNHYLLNGGISLQELLEDGQMDQFHKALVELNMDSAEELQSYIHKLSLAIEQTKQKILQAEVSIEVDVVDSKPEVRH